MGDEQSVNKRLFDSIEELLDNIIGFLFRYAYTNYNLLLHPRRAFIQLISEKKENYPNYTKPLTYLFVSYFIFIFLIKHISHKSLVNKRIFESFISDISGTPLTGFMALAIFSILIIIFCSKILAKILNYYLDKNSSNLIKVDSNFDKTLVNKTAIKSESEKQNLVGQSQQSQITTFLYYAVGLFYFALSCYLGFITIISYEKFKIIQFINQFNLSMVLRVFVIAIEIFVLFYLVKVLLDALKILAVNILYKNKREFIKITAPISINFFFCLIIPMFILNSKDFFSTPQYDVEYYVKDVAMDQEGNELFITMLVTNFSDKIFYLDKSSIGAVDIKREGEIVYPKSYHDPYPLLIKYSEHKNIPVITLKPKDSNWLILKVSLNNSDEKNTSSLNLNSAIEITVFLNYIDSSKSDHPPPKVKYEKPAIRKLKPNLYKWEN